MNPQYICKVSEIRSLEEKSFKLLSSYEVMQRAGCAVAKACPTVASAIAIAGSGNNGGDAISAAQQLQQQGVDVVVWMPMGKAKPNTDAAKAAADYRAAGGSFIELDSLPEIYPSTLVIDGLFGIGLNRDLDNHVAKVVNQINSHHGSIIAVDLPSGLDADSGAIHRCAVRAKRTVTMYASKPGLHMRNGLDLVGSLVVDDLGFDKLISKVNGRLIDNAEACASLRRSADSHKGTFGTLVMIGGANGMTGALALASRAAVSHGTGKVIALSLGAAPAFDSLAPEVMWHSAEGQNLQINRTADVLVVGCGMGSEIGAVELADFIINAKLPAVFDADALNVLATLPVKGRIRGKLISCFAKYPSIFTPHPAEAARLLGTTVVTVQADRLAAAEQIANDWNCTVVLKGAGTVVISAGKMGIVAAGNPALAQAGSGDLLTGIIGALLAQGLDSWDSASCGAWLHAKAADLARREQGGTIGVRLDRINQMSSRLLAGVAQ